MYLLSGDEMWNVAWPLKCVCVFVSLYSAKKEESSSIFHEEIGGVWTGFCYNNCKTRKKIPRNWWFVVVLKPNLFISINPKTFAEKRLECTLRKTLIRKIIYMTNTWNMKCFFATIHCLSIQMHPFLRCSNFLPELKVYKQLVFYKALRPFGYTLS